MAKLLNKYAERGKPRLEVVTAEEWSAAMDGFCTRARGRAANLAAHNWEPVGMHTNGGCRCWDDRHKAQRMMMAARRLRAALTKDTQP